jgi:hypothetical protein
LAELRTKLQQLADGDISKIRVAIEVPRGAIVETLLENLFTVYSINPKQLDRFPDRYSPSGAKDDRRDAFVMADSLRTNEPCYRQLALSDPVVIELRQWSRLAEEIRQERVRQANRFRELLQRNRSPGDLLKPMDYRFMIQKIWVNAASSFEEVARQCPWRDAFESGSIHR